MVLVDEDGGDGWAAAAGADETMDDETPSESFPCPLLRSSWGWLWRGRWPTDRAAFRLPHPPAPLALRLTDRPPSSLRSPLAVETKAGEFKSAQRSNWAEVHTGDTPPPEEELPPPPADEAPQVVVVAEEPPPRRGGLRTAAQLREQEERQRLLEAAEQAARADPAEEAELARLAQETVYRDSSGKKVDMKAERAAEKRRRKEADEKEAAKMEWGKGVVQRGEKEAQARREADERNRDLARCGRVGVRFVGAGLSGGQGLTGRARFGRRRRYANDADLNRELKDVSRWNDPAANFLTVRLPPFQVPASLRPRPSPSPSRRHSRA